MRGHPAVPAPLTPRAPRRAVQLVLEKAGVYMASFDNSFSVWRSKQLRFLLRLIPLGAWRHSQHGDRRGALEAECTQCKARSKELTAEIKELDARVLELETALANANERLEAAKGERERTRARLKAAKAAKAELSEDGNPSR